MLQLKNNCSLQFFLYVCTPGAFLGDSLVVCVATLRHHGHSVKKEKIRLDLFEIP